MTKQSFGVYNYDRQLLAIFNNLEDLATTLDNIGGDFRRKCRRINASPYSGPFMINVGTLDEKPCDGDGKSRDELKDVTASIEVGMMECGFMKHRLKNVRAILLAPRVDIAKLPSLGGTQKQVDWASKIRLDVAKANALHPAIYTEAEAKWWIDRRDTLDYYQLPA